MYTLYIILQYIFYCNIINYIAIKFKNKSLLEMEELIKANVQFQSTVPSGSVLLRRLLLLDWVWVKITQLSLWMESKPPSMQPFEKDYKRSLLNYHCPDPDLIRIKQHQKIVKVWCTFFTVNLLCHLPRWCESVQLWEINEITLPDTTEEVSQSKSGQNTFRTSLSERRRRKMYRRCRGNVCQHFSGAWCWCSKDPSEHRD